MDSNELSQSANNITSDHPGHASENDNSCMPHFHIKIMHFSHEDEFNDLQNYSIGYIILVVVIVMIL